MTTWRLESMCTRTLSTTISMSPLRARGSSLAMAGLSHAEPGGRPRRLRPAATPADRPDHETDGHACQEAADVGEDRDAASGARDAQRRHPVDQLEQEPQPQDQNRRNVQQ